MKWYLLGIFSGIFFTAVFLYSLILNITKPVGFIYIDAHHVNFILKHNIEVFSSGNWKELTTLPMFYGIKNSLFFTDHYLFPSLVALPLYLLFKDIILVANLLTVGTIFASFFSMYALAFHFTKRVWPSIIAATIYVFNPFITNWIPEYLLLYSLQWIPLIILFFEKSLKSPTRKNTFSFFLFLTLQLLSSSLYYSAFLTVILPLYMVIRFWQKKIFPAKLCNWGTLTGLVLFGLVTILDAYLYLQVFSQEPINRSLAIAEYFYSAWIANWFFTVPSNLIYGSLRERVISLAPNFFPYNNLEQSLFWGLTPFFIFLLSFFILKKSAYRKIWLLFLGLLIVSLLLSLGPRIHLTTQLSLPGPYLLIYKLNPLFSFLRVPARFALFVFFFLALIVALTIKEISKKLTHQKVLLLGTVTLFLILVEYANRPFEFTQIPPQTKKFYQFLEEQKNIKVILDLPISNRIPNILPSARAETLDAHYLFWATTLHSKKLFNGYSSFIPAKYFQRAYLLSIDFPTSAKLTLLKIWGVDGIVLHEDEFKSRQDFDKIKNGLIKLDVPQIVSANPPTGELILFDLTKWKSS